jgi:hypothetical protein
MTLFFLCSPSLGILDCWLPVLWNLKSTHPDVKICFIFPKHSTLQQLNTENLLLEISDTLVDKVIYKSFFGTWHSCASISCAKLAFSRLSTWHIFNRISDFLNLRLPSFLPLRIVSLISKYSLFVFSFNRFIDNHPKSKNILLYDVYEESKSYFRNFFDLVSFDSRFSMFHGVDIPIVPEKPIPYKIDSNNLRVFAYSHAECDYYIQYLKLPPKALSVVGIPRHDPKWINRIISYNRHPDTHSRLAVLFTRPDNKYLPQHRKLESLRSIKHVLKKYDIHLLVKVHPKEHDISMYMRVFGTDRSEFSWSFTTLHPFILSRSIIFSIVFLSNICIDMTALGVPTLQYLDLTDLPRSVVMETKTYSSHGFVKLLSTSSDLDLAVSNILSGDPSLLSVSKQNYQELFPHPDQLLTKLTNIILGAQNLTPNAILEF